MSRMDIKSRWDLILVTIAVLAAGAAAQTVPADLGTANAPVGAMAPNPSSPIVLKGVICAGGPGQGGGLLC